MVVRKIVNIIVRGDQRSAVIITNRDVKRRSNERAERKAKSIMSLLHDARVPTEFVTGLLTPGIRRSKWAGASCRDQK